MEDDQLNTTTLGNIDKAVTVISKETSASTGTTNQVVTTLQNGVKDLNQLAAQAGGETEGKLGGLISKAAAICQKLAGLAAGLVSSAISLISELTSSIKNKFTNKKDGNDTNNVNDEISKAIDGAAHSADIAAIKRGGVIGFSRA